MVLAFDFEEMHSLLSLILSRILFIPLNTNIPGVSPFGQRYIVLLAGNAGKDR